MDNKLVGSRSFLIGRGGIYCRGCNSTDLFSALNLGELPIANELLVSKEYGVERFPLHLKICKNCGLGQVADVVSPERIFRNYRYLSSMSTTFLKHAADFVLSLDKKMRFHSDDWVLEIASNDGYLLKNFVQEGIKCIGIEPAQNVAEISRSLGIETISEFFSSDLAREIVAIHGFPKLIIANNVMAHVPDLLDFVQGLSLLTGPDTIISIENPSLANILLEMQFDTIYHEHYSYLTATSVDRIVSICGLQLIEIEELATHGGSNRYWLARQDSRYLIDPSVDSIKLKENNAKLFDSEEWENYTAKVGKIIQGLESWLLEKKRSNCKVLGYGAAAKASTLLNCIPVDSTSVIQAIADMSLEKQKRFMPSMGIPIVSLEDLENIAPSDVLIFPWNIKAEIAKELGRLLGPEVRLWCAIPELLEIS